MAIGRTAQADVAQARDRHARFHLGSAAPWPIARRRLPSRPAGTARGDCTDVPEVAREPSMTEDELPDGWDWAAIRDVTETVPNYKPESEPNREFGYVDISSICNQTNRIIDHKRFKGLKAPSRARRPIRRADVLFSNVRTYLRNIALVPEDSDVQLCSTGFTVLRPNGAVDPQYLFRYVLTDAFLDRVTPQQTGTHYPATSDRVVMGEFLPVPPLAEQKRIVAKVEALLARVNAARQRLAKVPAILKQFRQSVLAAACSGRLTGDWRKEQTNLDPTSALKERIETKRKKPFRKVDDAELSEIPESWGWVYLPELGHMNRGKSRHRPRNAPHLYGGPYPFIQTGDIAQSGGRITNHTQTYSEAGVAQTRL